MAFPFRAAAAAALLALSSCAPAIVGGVAATAAGGVAQERSTRDALDDIETQVAINNALLNESGALFSGVNIGVHEGRVLLTGSAPSPAEAARAVEIARAQRGAREVIDELQPASRSYQGVASDAWISAQVRGRLVTEAGIDSLDYNIETYDGVVYLLGTTRSRDALSRAVAAASKVPGVTRVVSHVLTIDDPRRKGPAA